MNGKLTISKFRAAKFSQPAYEKKYLLPAICFMLLAMLLGIIFFTFQSLDPSALIFSNVIIWICLTFFVTSLPLFYYWYKGRFDLFNPIVFASWSYFMPVFAVGGSIFTSGLFQPYYSYLIQDPKNDVPTTFLYIIIGFLSLWLGFEIKAAKKLGSYFNRKIPQWNWQPSELVLPGFILLGIGVFFNLTSLISGVLMGHQFSSQLESFDNIQFFLSLFILEGTYLLWAIIFKTKQKTPLYYLMLLTVVLIVPFRIILLGNRGSLFQSFILATTAYFYSGKRFTLKKATIFSGFLIFAILFGMIWGTTFRMIKGDDSKFSTEQYITTVGETADSITSIDLTDNLMLAANSFSERLENFSALAVVVSNYEKLEPYEEAYGLKNNIWTNTWTAFIPRIIWPDKPVISAGRVYSELYFDYGDNSFPITPIGDLLRNFGPFGIPAGMLLLGFCLRLMYSLLIENKVVTIWYGLVYFMLIARVSYEGFYGTILPDIIRTLFILTISLLITNFFTGRKKT